MKNVFFQGLHGGGEPGRRGSVKAISASDGHLKQKLFFFGDGKTECSLADVIGNAIFSRRLNSLKLKKSLN